MRRIQIYIDEVLDDTLEEEAARGGVSKAELIRRAVASQLSAPAPRSDDPWLDLAGWLDDEPVDDIDAYLYGPRS